MNRARLLACAAFAVAAAASVVRADDPLGPRIGNNKYTSKIERGPLGVNEIDTDDYVALLVAGEVLSVTIKSPFQSPLFPSIELLGPDGSDRTPPVISKGLGKKSSFKKFVIPETGFWVVRIGGQADTEGIYRISFRIKVLGKTKLKKRNVVAGNPVTFDIEGVEGSELDLQLKWRKKDSPVRLVSLTDPDGNEVLVDGVPAVQFAVLKGRKLTLKRALLTGGNGTYRATVSVDTGAATFDLTYRVLAVDRPRGRKPKKLLAPEPYLDPRIKPMRGVEGLKIRLTGQNFSTGALPVVLFGDTPGGEPFLNEIGTVIDLLPPPGMDDTTVSVAVVNPDGQAYRRESYFYYVPPPTITSMEDASTGAPALGGSSAGGRRIRLRGTFFQTGVLVRFGAAPLSIPQVSSQEEMLVTTPPHAEGLVDVTVFDVFDHENFAPDQYEYKDPPGFAVNAYSPPVASEAGGTVVTITGTRFELTDVLLFDGAEYPSSWAGPTFHQFTTPALPDGSYSLEIRDRFGTVARGPDFRIKGPGVITSVAVVDGPELADDEVPLTGGSTLLVTGTNFHTGDRITLGGNDVTAQSTTPTQLRLTVPAGSPGNADLSITDLFGDTATHVAAVRYVGYSDETGDRNPGSSSDDDFSALRGVLGDLDGDGAADDLAIVSFDSPPGTGASARTEYTRIFSADDNGDFTDDTAANFPSANAVADFASTAVAIGDVDGSNGPDVLIAWVLGQYDTTSGELRIFENDGDGSFTRATGEEPGSLYRAAITAEDENGRTHTVFYPRYPLGVSTSMVLGDLDGDGDLDVVLGRDHYEYVYLRVDPMHVDFTRTPPYVNSAYVFPNANFSRYDYYPATRILDNDIENGNGFVDITDNVLPSAGDSADLMPSPAFHARDVALGDLDGDDRIDLVIAWDDPTSVTATGLSPYTPADVSRVATRVLRNTATGFSDVTSTFLPAGIGLEQWQAHRVELADLDGDGDLDLVLLLAEGVDAFQATPAYNRHALRVLTYDANTTPRFTDVTALVLPRLTFNGNENYRGTALAVQDVNGDGLLDIVIGTTSPPSGGTSPLRGTRLLVGTAGFVFKDASAFLPPTSVDSGHADDLLLGDLAGNSDPSLILLTETSPGTSTNSEHLRVFEWHR